MGGHENVLMALGLAIGPAAFLMLLLGIQALLSPKRPTDLKASHYECGIAQAGSPWAPVNVRFSAVALVFVIFDAEAVLFFAVASALKGSLVAVIEAAVFAAFLAVGLAFAWRKGVLTWPW